MNHPFFSSSELDDRTDGIEDLHDLSFVDVTDFHVFNDSLDELECFLTCLLRLRSDGTLTIIFEIDLHTELFFDALDRLASLSDHFTHFLLWYTDREEKWRIWREFFARF